jgi:hypothetical protein
MMEGRRISVDTISWVSNELTYLFYQLLATLLILVEIPDDSTINNLRNTISYYS